MPFDARNLQQLNGQCCALIRLILRLLVRRQLLWLIEQKNNHENDSDDAQKSVKYDWSHLVTTGV
jgi:hypothetical protein